MREFFDATEAAVELQRLTKLEWTAAQVLREAENGNLPICFQHQGKIGVFNSQEPELGQSIFGKALRTIYLPRGSYLRVQGHNMLTDVRQKQDSLRLRNLELVKLARGASEVSVTPSETLRIVCESGGFKDTALAVLQVPSTEWLFHAEDLDKFAPQDNLHAFTEDVEAHEAMPAQAQTATPAPVVAVVTLVEPAKAGPLPLTTSDIAFCFAGLKWATEQAWKKPLGDKPKWLQSCVVIPGVRGVNETRWTPVSIGAALVRDGVKLNSVRGRFQRNHLLTPWLEEWKTYEADNFPT